MPERNGRTRGFLVSDLQSSLFAIPPPPPSLSLSPSLAHMYVHTHVRVADQFRGTSTMVNRCRTLHVPVTSHEGGGRVSRGKKEDNARARARVYVRHTMDRVTGITIGKHDAREGEGERKRERETLLYVRHPMEVE